MNAKKNFPLRNKKDENQFLPIKNLLSKRTQFRIAVIISDKLNFFANANFFAVPLKLFNYEMMIKQKKIEKIRCVL